MGAVLSRFKGKNSGAYQEAKRWVIWTGAASRSEISPVPSAGGRSSNEGRGGKGRGKKKEKRLKGLKEEAWKSKKPRSRGSELFLEGRST